jgi:hypothetical protein
MKDQRKKIEELVAAVEKQGWTASNTGRHWRVVSPAGKIVFLPSTPSEYRSVKNARALLRRCGAKL